MTALALALGFLFGWLSAHAERMLRARAELVRREQAGAAERERQRALRTW